MGRRRALSDEQQRQVYAYVISGRSVKSVADLFGVSQSAINYAVRAFESERAEEAAEERAMLGLDGPWCGQEVRSSYGECAAKPERVLVRLCGGEVAERWRCGACRKLLRGGRPAQCGSCGTTVRWDDADDGNDN